MRSLFCVISSSSALSLLDNIHFREDKVIGFPTGQTIINRNLDHMVDLSDTDFVDRLAASGQPFINIGADIWTLDTAATTRKLCMLTGNWAGTDGVARSRVVDCLDLTGVPATGPLLRYLIPRAVDKTVPDTHMVFTGVTDGGGNLVRGVTDAYGQLACNCHSLKSVMGDAIAIGLKLNHQWAHDLMDSAALVPAINGSQHKRFDTQDALLILEAGVRDEILREGGHTAQNPPALRFTGMYLQVESLIGNAGERVSVILRSTGPGKGLLPIQLSSAHKEAMRTRIAALKTATGRTPTSTEVAASVAAEPLALEGYDVGTEAYYSRLDLAYKVLTPMMNTMKKWEDTKKPAGVSVCSQTYDLKGTYTSAPGLDTVTSPYVRDMRADLLAGTEGRLDYLLLTDNMYNRGSLINPEGYSFAQPTDGSVDGGADGAAAAGTGDDGDGTAVVCATFQWASPELIITMKDTLMGEACEALGLKVGSLRARLTVEPAFAAAFALELPASPLSAIALWAAPPPSCAPLSAIGLGYAGLHGGAATAERGLSHVTQLFSDKLRNNLGPRMPAKIIKIKSCMAQDDFDQEQFMHRMYVLRSCVMPVHKDCAACTAASAWAAARASASGSGAAGGGGGSSAAGAL